MGVRKRGNFFTSYDQSMAFFGSLGNWPIVTAMAVILFLIVPAVSNDYVLGSILVPVAIISIAVMGLNLLMGYAGQPSLGTGGLMAVGAFTTYKLVSTVPELPMVFAFTLGGVAAGIVGVIFGLTSLRLRAFYLAIATLAAQFFLEWVFSKIAWFWNYQAQGIITPPPVTIFGAPLDTKVKVYLFVVLVTLVLAALAHNLLRSHVGRQWIAIRDNDIAAEIIGVNIPMAKLTVFAISSFYCGIAGGLLAFIHIQSVTISTFTFDMSLKVMVHGHRRRYGKSYWLFPGGGVHFPCAYSPQRLAALDWAANEHRGPQLSGVDPVRRPHRCSPHCRPGWPGQAGALDEGQSSSLALSIRRLNRCAEIRNTPRDSSGGLITLPPTLSRPPAPGGGDRSERPVS